MAQFKLTLRDGIFAELIIEADSEEQAKKIFNDGDVDLSDMEITDNGGSCWEVYDVEEV